MAKTEDVNLFVRDMGVVCPTGDNFPVLDAALKSGLSCYQDSVYADKHFEPIKVAPVPDEALETNGVLAIQKGVNAWLARLLRLSALALKSMKTLDQVADGSLPLILCTSDWHFAPHSGSIDFFVNAINELTKNKIDKRNNLVFSAGRDGILQALVKAKKFLEQMPTAQILVGAVDSYRRAEWLATLDDDQRLLNGSNMSGFAPAEAAVFLIVSNHEEASAESEMSVNIRRISLGQENLDKSRGSPENKSVLAALARDCLDVKGGTKLKDLYSTVNGEARWNGSLGLLLSRSQRFFKEGMEPTYPAESIGDSGSASGAVCLGLAVHRLQNTMSPGVSAIACSSDNFHHGVAVLESSLRADERVGGSDD